MQDLTQWLSLLLTATKQRQRHSYILQVQALAALHGVTVAATKGFSGSVLQRTAQAGLPTPEGSVVVSRRLWLSPDDSTADWYEWGIVSLVASDLVLHAARHQKKQSFPPPGCLLAWRDPWLHQLLLAHTRAALLLRYCAPAESCQPGNCGLQLFCLLQASRIAEHGGSPPSDPLALAQACGLAMLLQRRPVEELPSGVHMMLGAVTSHQRIMAPQHSGALLRLEASPNAGATLRLDCCQHSQLQD